MVGSLAGFPFAWTSVKIQHAAWDLEEKAVYEATAAIDGVNFDDLSSKEDDLKKITVYPGMKYNYPWDKEVVISSKTIKQKIILFVENHDGKAKVVDAEVNGKQVYFK